MKDKIEQILRDNLVVSGSGLSILGTKGATNKLIELMCYREVKAYCKGRSVFLKVPNLIVALLKDSYSKEDILKAVEQVKNEPS